MTVYQNSFAKTMYRFLILNIQVSLEIQGVHIALVWFQNEIKKNIRTWMTQDKSGLKTEFFKFCLSNIICNFDDAEKEIF